MVIVALGVVIGDGLPARSICWASYTYDPSGIGPWLLLMSAIATVPPAVELTSLTWTKVPMVPSAPPEPVKDHAGVGHDLGHVEDRRFCGLGLLFLDV